MGYCRFSSLSNCSESGNATSGWSYTRTGSGDYTVNYAGGSDQSLPANTNGSFIFVMAAGKPNAGLDTNNTANHSGNWQIGCYCNALGSPYFFVINGTFDTAADTNVNAAVGDWVRFTRTGSTLVVDVSQNSGSTWTTIRTSTGWSTAQVYPKLGFNVDAGASIGPVTATQDLLRVSPRPANDVLLDDAPRPRRVSLAALGEGTNPLARRPRTLPDVDMASELPRRRTASLAALGEGSTPLGRRARTVVDEGAPTDLSQRRALPPLAALPLTGAPFQGRRQRLVADEAAGVAMVGELLQRRGLPLAAFAGGGTGGSPGAHKWHDRKRGREARRRG